MVESTTVRTSSQLTALINFDFLVNSTVETANSDINHGHASVSSIEALSNGNFAVFWKWGDGLRKIGGQILDSAGNKIGSAIEIIDDQLHNDVPKLLNLSNDTFLLTYDKWNYLPDPGHEIYGQIFDYNGSKIGEEFNINSVSLGDQNYLSIAELSNGNLIATWNSLINDSDVYTSDVYMQIFSNSGLPLLNETKLLTEVTDPYNIKINVGLTTALSDGNYVITWGDGGTRYAQIFDESGTPTDDKFAIEASTDYLEAAIIALPNNGFAVVGHIGSWPEYEAVLHIFSNEGVAIVSNVHLYNGSSVSFSHPLHILNEDTIFIPVSGKVFDPMDIDNANDTGVIGHLFDFNGNRILDSFKFTLPSDITGDGLNYEDLTVSDSGLIGISGFNHYLQNGWYDISTHLYKINSPSEGDLTIVGNVIEGETLSISNSITDTDGINSSSISYQWIWEHPTLGKFDIDGETSSEYVLHSSDVGSKISVRYTFTDNNGTVETVNSIATATIANNAATVTDTAGDDLVTGTAYADTIGAGIGRDVVNAEAGNDVITLTGNTTYDGKFAHNVGSTTQVATNVKLDLTGKVKLETVVDGGADADTVNLSSSDDAFFLHDSFSGFHSSLTLTTDTHTGAQSTQRIMNVETINGLGGDDIIDLTSPDYSLAGQVITINGGAGNDVIWGSDATETLIGGDGNDILFGGSGNDTLTGGAGKDVFEFTRTAGSDTITDFQSGSDSIKLYSDYTFNVSKTDSTTADYSIDGQSDPTLYLVRGKTYTFEMSGNGHPFYIKSTSSTSGTSDEYTDGVTRIGSANSGSDGDKLQFIAGVETPDTLWYQCSAHSGMLGQLNIIDKLSETVQTSGNNLIWNTLTIQSDTAIDLDDVSFVAIA